MYCMQQLDYHIAFINISVGYLKKSDSMCESVTLKLLVVLA